jgi:gas vesicle structural protein
VALKVALRFGMIGALKQIVESASAPPPQVIARRRKEDCKVARVQKSTDSSSLAEVVDRILDKGIVMDAWVKVSLVGIELLSIEARVVIASVETYLKYAEAIGLTASAATPA